MQERQKKNEDNKMISLILSVSGVMFILLAVFCLTNTSTAMEFLGVEAHVVKFIAGGLVIIGTSDLIIAKIFASRTKERR